MFFPDAEKARLTDLATRGLMELIPIAVPGAEIKYKHLGWPVATRMPDTGRIILTFAHRVGHANSTPDVPSEIDQMGRRIVHSDDLVTWAPQPILTGTNARPVGADTSGLQAIGVVKPSDSAPWRLVMLKSYQFRHSDDGGATWSALRRFTSVNPGLSEAANEGPNLINHPKFGLMADFAQQVFEDDINESDMATPEQRKNFLLRTFDGENWDVLIWKNPDKQRAVEPALATWGPGHIVRINREWSSYGYGGDPSKKYFYLTQHVYKYTEGDRFEDIKFKLGCTNIAGNGKAGGPVERIEKPGRACHDTPEVKYNPVSGRIEVLQSHRWGGGGLKTTHTLTADPEEQRNSLNLWSIDPDELLAGSSVWRFDGTLLERYGYSGSYGKAESKDGMHPGSSIIDTGRGQQHIFIYAGTRGREKGTAVYRLTRSLNTDAWRAAIGAPTVTEFSPATFTFGDTVTIRGTKFDPAGEVYFNGVLSPSYTWVSATEVRAVVPANVRGEGRIAVRNYAADGESAAKFSLVRKIEVSGALAAPVVLPGQEVTLYASVSAFPFDVVYKWEVDTGDGQWRTVEDSDIYDGAGTRELRIRSAGESMNNYKYRYTATNSVDSVSRETVLTVRPTPFSEPASLVVDAANGGLYVADAGKHAIYIISPDSGSMGLFAGNPGVPGVNNGGGTTATFREPAGIDINGAQGTLVIADAGNAVVRTLSAGGNASYLAGSLADPGFANGSGMAARFNAPSAVAVDAAGNTYVADANNHVIRMVTSAGAVSVIAGIPGDRGAIDGSGTVAKFDTPSGIAYANNALYVADTGNHLIRQVNLSGAARTVSILAGQKGVWGCSDGAGLTEARFNSPRGLVVDGVIVYVADTGNSLVRMINGGTVSTIAGHPGDDGLINEDPEGGGSGGPIPGVPGFKDGQGIDAWLRFPEDIAVGLDGALYVADTGNAAIRKIANDEFATVTTLTPLATAGTMSLPRGGGSGTSQPAGGERPAGGGGGAPSWYFAGALCALAAMRAGAGAFGKRK